MIRQITRDELLKMRARGEKFTLVDVLGKESFAREHIPGAISIPVSDIENLAGGLLDKNDMIIVYCASFECTASTTAAEKLEALGFKHVIDYKGGLKDYKEGGLALEGSLHECPSCASCCACD
ncbi:MAG: rhodanese-like domain-containing protein [Candidatus Omnitrophica bacterium]|nr:rhodanese-like domain-containing protein [Candidatus Omnitrophota bacterium]